MAEIIREPVLRSREQAAVFLGVSANTVSNMAKAGTLEKIQIGKLVRFRQSDLDRILNSQKKNSY